MTDEQAQARSDPPRERVGGPALARVRRRGESHLLALISAAAVVFVAIAIAKPWGDSASEPGASATTRSPVAEVGASPTDGGPPSEASAATPSWGQATYTETTQYVVIFEPGQDPADYTAACTFYRAYAAPTAMGTQIGLAGDPSSAQYFRFVPVASASGDTMIGTCADGSAFMIEWSSPNPTAP